MSLAFDVDQTTIPVGATDTLFPVRRIYCVGRNYAAHAREMGFDPDRDPPFFFCKPADAIVYCPPELETEVPYPTLTDNYHHEIELVIAIGKAGSNIKAANACDHIYGYATGLDMTRRDLQLGMRDKGRPWEVGKAFDHSAPIGPVYPIEDTGFIESGDIFVEVNGQVRQQSNITHLIWSVPEVIANLSTLFKLMPGDLVYTGTPEGVGPVTRGDILRGGVDSLGEIRVKIV